MVQVQTINQQIGATSAVAMQCKSLVNQYLPAIVKAVKEMPLDAVSALDHVLSHAASMATHKKPDGCMHWVLPTADTGIAAPGSAPQYLECSIRAGNRCVPHQVAVKPS
jgi:hypothetical protein